MSGMSDRHDAWDAILERLPARWRTGQPSYDPAAHQWTVAAIGPKLGGRHGPPPETIIGTGPDELEALRDLAERLAG
jgi:hypothetical protein